MPEATAGEAFRSLVAEAGSAAIAHGWPINAVRGIAFYDPAKDQRLNSLPSFPALVAELSTVPRLVERYGAAEVQRLTLQLIYEYFSTQQELAIDSEAIDKLWGNFIAELESEVWLTRGVANMRNFSSNEDSIPLSDGVSIRGRNFEELQQLGFGREILERISQDWAGFGASSYVIIVESSVAKSPNNFLTIDSGSLWIRAMRAIGALRLLGPGDVSFGPMWIVRVVKFNVGLGGISGTGVAIPTLGSQYAWTKTLAAEHAKVYSQLLRLDTQGYGRAPGNLDLALRAFMGTYDRWPPGNDSRLLDCVTALESVLGSGTEISFKLAFRVAGLLAKDDNERSAILEQVKGFYDTRSALVHGGRLKEKHQQRLTNVDELRALVRRLLKAFVEYGAGNAHNYSKEFFQQHLDAALVNAVEREKLRAALVLDKPS